MELTEIILTAEDYGTAERNLLLTEEGYRRRYMLAEGEESGIGGTGWACTEAGTGVSRRAKYCESAEELHGFLTGKCSGAGKEFWLDRNGSSPQCLHAAGEALRREYGQKGEWGTYMQGKTGKRAQAAARCRHLPACAGRSTGKCGRCRHNTVRNYREDDYFESACDRPVPEECPPLYYKGPSDKTAGYRCPVCGGFTKPHMLTDRNCCMHCGYRLNTKGEADS